MSRIMIVDDAVFIRKTLKLMLENNGFEVSGEAENGAVAIQLYKQHRPDVVTMDITMPEKNGIEALKEIMAEDPNANVIMISALGQENFVKDAIINGAKGFIVKPFKEEMVIKALNKFK